MSEDEWPGRAELVLAALDAVGDGVTIVDVATRRRVYANGAILGLTGFSRDEVVDVPVGSPPGVVERVRVDEILDRVVAGPDRDAVFTTTTAGRDGRRVPMEIRVTYRPPGPDEAGLGHVIGIARDLSDRIAAEEQIRRGQELFRAAFEGSPVGIEVLRLHADGRRVILRANQALADILGAPLAELQGADLAQFLGPRENQESVALAERLRAGPGLEVSSHRRFRRRDGSFGWVEIRAVTIDLPGEVERLAVAHVVDVTERVEDEQRRSQTAAVDRLIAEVATDVLAGRPLQTLHDAVVEGVAEVFAAENVTLGFRPEADTRGAGGFDVVAAVGPLSTSLLVGDGLPLPDDAPLARQGITFFDEPGPEHHDAVAAALGPGAGVRFGTDPDHGGVMVLARPRGAAPLRADEGELLARLARQLGLALELGRARADQERLAVVRERQRIARQVQDMVTQDLIAIGMRLDGGVPAIEDPQVQGRFDEAVSQLQESVDRLRAAVTQLGPPDGDESLSEIVRSVVTVAAQALGHRPTVSVRGPADALPAACRTEVAAALREALAGVVLRGTATRTEVVVDVDTEAATLTVEDDTGTRTVARSVIPTSVP